jgi:beta-glucosidase
MQAEEVVQLYASRPESAIERPAQELKAFQRVSLAPGESKQVVLTIPRDDFRHWDEATGGWQVESGKVVLRVGTSSRELSLQTEIQL